MKFKPGDYALCIKDGSPAILKNNIYKCVENQYSLGWEVCCVDSLGNQNAWHSHCFINLGPYNYVSELEKVVFNLD
jgi:hypothetical protein